MAELSLRTTYKDKLKPLPAHERTDAGRYRVGVWACGRVGVSPPLHYVVGTTHHALAPTRWLALTLRAGS